MKTIHQCLVMLVLGVSLACAQEQPQRVEPLPGTKPIEKKLGKHVMPSEQFEALQKKCGDSSCCNGSLNRIKEGQYLYSEDGNCPEGYRMDMFRCIDSLKWCEEI